MTIIDDKYAELGGAGGCKSVENVFRRVGSLIVGDGWPARRAFVDVERN
jgi:hypothetical protein